MKIKKLVLFAVVLLLTETNLFSQAVYTDVNGNKVSRGNVWLMVNEENFADGQRLSDKAKNDLSSATYLWTSKILIEEGFTIVNRDEEAMKTVNSFLKENKLEDYMDGLSVQAKGQGADYLILVDMTQLVENNKNMTVDYSYRIITIQNNICSHAKTRYEFGYENKNQLQKEIKNMLENNTLFFTKFMREFFPVQLVIESNKGKKLTMIALQPVGRLYVTDNLYLYTYGEKEATLQGKKMKFDTLDLLSKISANDVKLNNGRLVGKSDKAISDKNTTFISLAEKNTLKHHQRYPTTIVGIPYNLNEKDGYVKKMVNQAVYCGLDKVPHFMMIESDMLPFLKKEKELQKTEDFLNGYAIEQLKSMGALYLVHISNFENNKDIVSFTLSLIDVSKNTVAKTIECKSHISNLDELIYAKLKSILMDACVIEKFNDKKIEILTSTPIDVKVGDNSYILAVVRPLQSPTGEAIHQRVDIARLKYVEYHGMKHIFKIDKVLDKKELSNINDYVSKQYNFYLKSDDILPDVMKNTSIFK